MMRMASTSTSLMTSGLPSLCRDCFVLKGIGEQPECCFSHCESHRLQISNLIQPSRAPFVRTRDASSASRKHMKEPIGKTRSILKPPYRSCHSIHNSSESSGLINCSQEEVVFQHNDSTNWQNGQLLDLKSPKVPRNHFDLSEFRSEITLRSL